MGSRRGLFGVAALLGLIVGSWQPALGVNLLEPGDVPDNGHWRVRTNISYTPYYLSLHENLKKLKDCPAGDTSDECKVTRPIESYHWGELGTNLELGLGAGLGLHVRVPVDVVVRYTSDPALLPPGTRAQNLGFGDLSLGVSRAIYAGPDGGMRLTLGANLPPNEAPQGNEVRSCPVKGEAGANLLDAAGKPIQREYIVFPAAPSADLGLAFTQGFFSQLVWINANGGLNFPFRRTGPEPVVTWRGLRYSGSVGLELRPLRQVGIHLESLTEWTNPAEQDRVIVCETGHFRTDIAPGLSLQVAPGWTLKASGVLPVLFSGYERDFPEVIGNLGLSVDL